MLTYGRTLEATKVQEEAMINSTIKSMPLNAIKIPSKTQSADNRSVQYKRLSSNYSHQMAPPRGNYKYSASTYSEPDQTCPRCGGRPHNRNKSANALALCHPPSASFCSVLAVQWSSRIFTHDRYNIPSDILIEFEVNLGIIIEKYA